MAKPDAGVKDPGDIDSPTPKPTHQDVFADLIRATNDCVADLAELIKLVKAYKLTQYERL